MDVNDIENVKRKEVEMKRIPITAPAYDAAVAIGRSMRKQLGGYKPDVSLVVSALTEYGLERGDETKDIIRKYTAALFAHDKHTGVDNASPAGPSTEPAACPKRTFSG